MRWAERIAAPDVVVYTRRNCGLCATAEKLAADEAPAGSVRLVDVDADDELQRRFHVRVPVVEVDGDVVAEAVVEPGVISRAVRAARWRRLRDG